MPDGHGSLRRARLRAAASATGIAVLGVAAGILSALVAGPAYELLLPDGRLRSAVDGYLVQPGFGIVAAGYAWRREEFAVRPLLRPPSTEGVLWILLGPAAYEALARAAGHLLAGLGREPFAAHGDAVPAWRTLAADPALAAFALVVVFAVMAPLEELLYRSVVHDRLAEGFGPAGRTAIGAALFGAMHGILAAGLNSVVLTGVGGLVFAAAYERTDTLVVPVGIHGLYWIAFTPL